MSPAALATTNLNGVRKAAVLLVLLGEEAAATVYRISARRSCSV